MRAATRAAPTKIKMRVLIADGGTGGHIFPAIAVANELKNRSEVESILFTGTPYGLEDGILPRHGYELKMIHVGGLIGKSIMTRVKTLLQLPGAYFQSAKIIKEFRKKGEKPVLKGAFINDEIYIGDNLLESLASLKSKEEVIGEIIGLLQSPAQRIISALLNNAETKGEAAE